MNARNKADGLQRPLSEQDTPTSLIFCFDGTESKPLDAADYYQNSSITNILKLHILLGGTLSPLNTQNPKTLGQHSFYYKGIGTYSKCWIIRKLNALMAPEFSDVKTILKDALKNLKQHYQEGGKIYVLGYSRGAAIARRFCVKCPYPIKFLGVFDTVAAIKNFPDLNPDTLPETKVLFENGTLSHNVAKAAHALALDEERLIFQPTLINHDHRVTEVWFAGSHGDVGGGYWFDGLSDIALQFMMHYLKDLTLLKETEIDYTKLKDETGTGLICWDDLYLKPMTTERLHTHFERGVSRKTMTAPRYLRVNVNDQPNPDLIPLIHHSVLERFNRISDYRPYPLRNRKFRVFTENFEIETEPIRQGIAKLSQPTNSSQPFKYQV